MSNQRSYFPLRFTVYLVLVGLMLLTVARLVMRFGFQAILIENAVVEWASVAVCVLTFLVFCWIAVRNAPVRGLALALGGLSLAAAVREMDFFLTTLVSERFHHAVLFLVFAFVLVDLIVFRKTIRREAMALVQRPAFVPLILGFIIVIFWAQVLGERKLWGYFGQVYGPFDPNGAKCMIEETLELAGYVLIFFGAVEELIRKR